MEYTELSYTSYKQLSASTLSRKFVINDVDDLLLLHAAIGIVTEYDELMEWLEQSVDRVDPNTQVRLSEELTDIMWYLMVFVRHYEKLGIVIEVEDHDTSLLPIEHLLILLRKESIGILDIYKKGFFYPKKIDDAKIISSVKTIWLICNSLYSIFGIDKAKSRANNINKLFARNKGTQFNGENTNNRDLDKELEILKK